jgi:tetratricopeptide (TPR) repeat protein
MADAPPAARVAEGALALGARGAVGVEEVRALAEAVAIDPDFALGHAALARAHQVFGNRAPAKTAIARKDWAGAQAVLEPYTASNPRSADGFNLLGYSLRNQKKYDDSLVAYKQALTLDPKHRGAHEYIGMAYVQMGQLDKAKEHLASLDKICPFSCEEYRDLKKAIAEVK